MEEKTVWGSYIHEQNFGRKMNWFEKRFIVCNIRKLLAKHRRLDQRQWRNCQL